MKNTYTALKLAKDWADIAKELNEESRLNALYISSVLSDLGDAFPDYYLDGQLKGFHLYLLPHQEEILMKLVRKFGAFHSLNYWTVKDGKVSFQANRGEYKTISAMLNAFARNVTYWGQLYL